MGSITQDSYLFFSSKLGDLLLEPGDEIILVARHRNHEEESGGWGDSRFFEGVKNSHK